VDFMHVQFWGTRGSIAKPGPHTARYGGNTSCVELRSSRGTLVIIDCGTGAHPLGLKLMAGGGKGMRGHILIGHTHWDHIQGLPFFAPLFVPGNEWDVYGPKGLDQSLRETLSGQMEYNYFPVTPDQFGAKIRYHDLLEGTFKLDDIVVTTQYLNHPALTLGYRLEADGATVVYCCDHEPHSRALASGQGEFAGQDQRHAEFVRGADLLIHDAQYTVAEYPSKVGWGHSPAEFVVRLCQHADVRNVALTHHDPLRSDDALDGIVAGLRSALQAQGSALQVSAAAEGSVVEVKPSGAQPSKRPTFQATTALDPQLAERSVLLNVADSSIAAVLSDAIRAEGIRVSFFSSVDDAKRLIEKDRPSLVIIEHDNERDGMALCRRLRQIEGGAADQLPIVMVAAQDEPAAGAAAGVTDWLLKPFASSYSRTKIRSWVLRVACNWLKAAVPDDEAQRLHALRDLKVLDTEAEDRFDRVTRLATALFDVPMAMISLVDANRQWFKSCIGASVRETSRDVAFCAHVVYKREPMIVPDAFQDPRFADNPLVREQPRIRFYAGYPLILDNGSCVGTLCLLDTRPRTLQGPDLERLHDLANIALQELRGAAPPRGGASEGQRTAPA
jgi:phosphoribosyl 1,2-cyclic phosphodiesterase/CheY-like chemotaxis protein